MDQLFITINIWLTSGTYIALLASFLWGVVSILFSPCHLASIPLIVSYVGGQESLDNGRKGCVYAVLFTIGLFITIAAIGIVTALLGRMLGDVGAFWSIPVGIVFLLVSLDMLGFLHLSMGTGLLSRITMTGYMGAFVLGLAYGVLSGTCTFGFIAPILGVITVQKQVLTGVLLIVLFGIGHCLPIAIAGSSTAVLKSLVSNSRWQSSSLFVHKLAGSVVGIFGVYFIIQPFIEGF